MLGEIGLHLEAYEATLAQHCGPEHESHGICLGEAWEMLYSDTLEFPASLDVGDGEDYDFVIPADKTFRFTTKSHPPTFLVGVEPLEPHACARWQLSFTDHEGEQRPFTQSCKDYTVVEKRSESVSSDFQGAIVMKSKYDTPTQFHVFVVDSKIGHLSQIRGQEQCSFEKSWKNFNERHNGQHHGVLVWTWRLAASFLVISLAALVLMARRFLLYVEGGKLLSRLIIAKFLVQDFPQQLCIVAYIYGWYADNGLRCQMCLFHPDHCDDEYPLHWGNLMLCLFTLLSASANQLILQVKPSRHYDEDAEFFACLFRFSLISVSTLPFSTGMLVMSSAVLHLRSPLVFMVCGLPCLLGWSMLLCLPMGVICDED